MAIMSIIKSSLLDKEQKYLLKDAILLYVTNLQKRYFRDNILEESTYLEKMKEVEELVKTLHLNDLYKLT
jgi:hypothetical protein|tara:strand:- start:483 stop:692 length:210 start_codon:yes stop_codon:yes gene_type:complete